MPMDSAMRRVRLQHLQTLAAVVQAGGIRKAAQDLHLSQSAVSRVVAELEDLVGLPLLERSVRGAAPTLFGAALVRRSSGVFDELRGALRELDELADPGGGLVRVGCVETLHAGLVGAAIEALMAMYPRLRCEVESGQAPDLIDHFLPQRRVDFVVARPYQLPLPSGLVGEPLFRECMGVVVGRGSPLARRRRISLKVLSQESWILSRNETMPGTPLTVALDAAGLALPAHMVVSGSLLLRFNLLAGGRFVSLVPHSVLPFGRHREMLRTLPLELPAWQTPTMILTLAGRTLAPAAQVFLSKLRELAVPLNPDQPTH